MRQLFVPATLVRLCISSSAFAATLSDVAGQVAINKGDGFQRVEGTTQARAGDLIVARQGGRANLTYEDGCLVKVRPGSPVRVSAKSPCNATYMLNGQSEPGFLRQLGPFFLGGAAVFTAFCISACDDDRGNGRISVSP